MRIRDIAGPRLTAFVGASAVVLAVGAAGVGAAGVGAATADAPAAPDPTSCAGQTVDRSAPVISGHDVFVPAPPEDVWAVHTAVESYPGWKSGVPYAQRLDAGPLRTGSRFRWENGGMPIVSTVRAAVPGRCTLWGGPSKGIDGVHLWTFTPAPGGTLVHTEESWSGAPVDGDPVAARALLDKAMAQGSADLERVVARPHHP